MLDAILVINAGSSSIKFAIFGCDQSLSLLYRGEIESVAKSSYLTIYDANRKILQQSILSQGVKEGLGGIFSWIGCLEISLKAASHRIVRSWW